MQGWIDIGYTKPTAKSMAILHNAIEFAQGHPGHGLFPWSVRFNKKAEAILGTMFVCKATDLHRLADKWETIRK